MQKFLSSLPWKTGRQNTGYKKILLFQLFNMIDCYLLYYTEGDYIPEHIDEVNNKKHYRGNLVLLAPKLGGIFWCDKSIIDLPRLKLFRPDLYKHGLTKIEKGYRLVLSFGVAI